MVSRDGGIFGVPRVPEGMLARTALRDRLGRAPLTVVRAPGGSGKTVLLAQWAAERGTAGVWVTVEPDIGDRAGFWTAVADGAAPTGARIPASEGVDPDAFRGALLRAFRGVTEPFVLVVDDAHELRDPLVAEDVLAVLRACPHVTALVGTRSRGELEAARNGLTLDLEVVGPEELALSAAEVESIVGARGSRVGSVEELLTASGGNPLLLRAILAGGAAPSATGSAHAVVADHLRGLLATHGVDAAVFAASTSVPDDLDAALAEHLSGLGAGRVAALLRMLEAEGLLMRHGSPGGERFRYHPLVRESLRAQLRREHPEQYRRASQVASADAEGRRQFLPALRHAVEAEDYTRASDVCLHGGFTLLRSRGAAAVLQDVPLRYVARLPFLAVVLGLAANARGERLKALELLALALGASRAWRGRQRIDERAGLALVETVVLRITGRAGDAVPAARRMLALLEEAAPGDLEEISEQLGSYRHQGALSLFRGGRLAEARLAAERVGISEDALRRARPESLGAAALVAAVEAVRGEGRAAEATLARIDGGEHPVDLRDGYVGSLAHLARGILALDEGDPDAAERATDLFRDRENLEHGPAFSALRALVALWRGRPEVGLRVLDEREGADRPRARTSPEDRRVAAGARTLLHAALGQLGPAHTALRTLERSDPAGRILHAALLLVEQRPDLALERLSDAAPAASPRVVAAGEILRASAALARGDEALAATALRRFLATTAVHGSWGVVVLVPADHREALAGLAERIDATGEEVARLRWMPAPLRTASARATLTRREADVLEQLRRTGSLPEIAATLSVSANTVKSQARTLYRKLGVSTREEALRVAYLHGLLEERAAGD